MTTSPPDHRALQLASKFHEEHNPLATILFGSRARGDYLENDSDIDIMLIVADLPPKEQQEALENWAKAQTPDIFNRPIEVQLSWYTKEEFQKGRTLANHLVTRALKDGVMVSSYREEFSSRYPDEENEHQVNWKDYDTKLRRANVYFDMFETAAELEKDDLAVGEQAQQALENAMKALIAVHGRTYAPTHDLGDLLGTLRRTDPQLTEFRLSIDPAIYSEYGGRSRYQDERSHPRLTSQENYRELTSQDIHTLIERAADLDTR